MRTFIDCSKLLENESFLLWFLMTSFPTGLTENEDSIDEVMGDKYNDKIEQDFIDNLTGYYDGIFKESDGYIDVPKSVKLDLNGDELVIEFHAGDTVYYLNDKMLGCTGSEYSIWKIPFEHFLKYSEKLNSFEKFLLLPMVFVIADEEEEYNKIIYSVVENIGVLKDDFDDICRCIFTNCLKE